MAAVQPTRSMPHLAQPSALSTVDLLQGACRAAIEGGGADQGQEAKAQGLTTGKSNPQGDSNQRFNRLA